MDLFEEAVYWNCHTLFYVVVITRPQYNYIHCSVTSDEAIHKRPLYERNEMYWERGYQYVVGQNEIHYPTLILHFVRHDP